MAGMTVFLGAWYLHWRWTESLNPEAMVFSIAVVCAETATFLGTCIFFFDIWDERDTPRPNGESLEHLGSNAVAIDVFIATLDEAKEILAPSVDAALALKSPKGVKTRIWLLDDGARAEIEALAQEKGIGYFSRCSNRGFKAGNLANALYQTHGDFVVICDADTQLFPSFIVNTIGYFADPKVAWVQTPHWFFDIPEGETWAQLIERKFGKPQPWLTMTLQRLTGRAAIGRDPFLSDPSVFFDVIQRRRNRNNASFCCGAASIHRREALFQNSLSEISQRGNIGAKQAEQQPFKFHVSEDIFTSIQLHSKSWKSVYHPQIEARMLSPWSVDAWAAQKHKYAGGTYDIMMWANPIFKRGLPWKPKLHYLATFWSYASVFWFPVLLLAPAVSLFSGVAPIDAYTFSFFAHLLPVLFCNEVALTLATKGYDTYSGRCLSMGTLLIQAKAFAQVARGLRPKFKPTPKIPGTSVEFAYAIPNLILILFLASAAVWGVLASAFGIQNYSLSLLVVNLFWIGCNILLLAKTVVVCLSTPAAGDRGTS
jgi:cellulose synthase (UDP-forming)